MRRFYLVLLATALTIAGIVVGTRWALASTGEPNAEQTTQQAGSNITPWRPGVYVIHGGYTGLLSEGNEDLGTTFPIAGNLRGFYWGHPKQADSVYIDTTRGVRIYGPSGGNSLPKWLEMQCEGTPYLKVKNRYAGFYIDLYGVVPGMPEHAKIPKYMYDTSNPGYALFGNRDEAVVDVTTPWGPSLIPKYWSRYFFNEYAWLIDTLAQKYFLYNWSDCLGFIAIGAGRDGETWPADVTKEPWTKTALKAAGLTSDLWVGYVNDIMDKYYTAYSRPDCGDKPCVPLLVQSFPYYESPSERTRISDHAAQLGVGLSLNSLFPDTGDNSPFDQIRAHPELPVAFEIYGEGIRIGCEDAALGEEAQLKGEAKELYWTLLYGFDLGADFMRIHANLLRKPYPSLPPGASDDDRYGYLCPYGRAFCEIPPELIKTENVRIFRWANQFFGKTLEDTPSVWVALREHRSPFQPCNYVRVLENTGHLETGNFEFGLYQNNNLPGGRTLAETNRYKDPKGNPVTHMGGNFEPYNPELPDIKEAWYIRRTDEATSNPYMFFDVSDDYLLGGTAQVTITITYLDMYTDTFTLHYQAVGQVDKVAPVTAVYEVDAVYDETPTLITSIAPGTTAIPKHGTKKLRQAVFVLNDARFHNDLPDGVGGADFYISSNNDGDEWVHMVSLTVNKDTYTPEPTPTPTPTATNTPTPTPTVTPTPTTARVEGVVWNDLNQNSVREAGEPGVPGATLKLLDQNTGQERYTQVSGADGAYAFPAVDPGAYTLKIIPPSGYRTLLFDEIPLGNLVGGQVLPLDIALVQLPTPTPTVTPTPTPAVVTGEIFEDTNGNGERDSGENGLAGVEVQLVLVQSGALRLGETVVATTTTDSTGAFRFENVADGTYRIVMGRVDGYIPAGGYTREIAVTRGNTYNITFPSRAVNQRHWVPMVTK